MLKTNQEKAAITQAMMIAALIDTGADTGKIDKALTPIKQVLGSYKVTIKKVKRGVFNSTSYRFNFQDRDISYADAKKAIGKSGLSRAARDFALSCFETL